MRTWIKLFIFLIPPGIVFGIPLLTLWMGGELTAPETVIKRQAETSRLVLHGAALSNTIIYEKVRAMQSAQAGDSRAWHIACAPVSAELFQLRHHVLQRWEV